ncbi:MAG: LysM peptidoglycan-binding domain-containing protein [Anaerolineales bacterium]|nr:LysM peptidoglycan-binding domain-containing protein [Anaerolineales bacterium]
MTRAFRLMVVALLAMSVWPVSAPVVQAAPARQGANLVSNPGFESGQGGWSPWWAEIAKPSDGSLNYAAKPNSFNVESLSNGAAAGLVLAGNSSYRVFNNWDPFWGGIKQTVTVPAGARVRLTASARAWASQDFWPAPSDTNMPVRTQVGIEPNGTDNPFAGTMVWSGAAAPHNAWAQMTVEATAGASGQVVVVLSGDYRGASRQFMGIFFDEVSLVVLEQGPAPTAVPPTAAPGATTAPVATRQPVSQATSTPRADGRIVYVVQAGDTGWVIAARAGLTVDQLRALNPGVDINVLSVGTELIVGGSPAGAATAAPGATAVATGDPAASPTPEASPTTGVEPTAAQPSAEATTAVEGAQICVGLFDDTNGNRQYEIDGGEAPLYEGLLTLINADTGAQLTTHQMASGEDSYCFTGLTGGNYQVAVAGPNGYNPTVQPDVLVPVPAGSTGEYSVAFGFQRSSAAPEATAEPAEQSGDRLRTALFGAVGVMLLLLAVGLGVTLVMRRR